MPEQIVKDAIFAAFDIDLYKGRDCLWQPTKGVVNGDAVVLPVTPNSLSEMNSVRPKEQLVVDPRKSLAQMACVQPGDRAQQLAERIRQHRAERHGVVVTMNDSAGVVLLETLFKRPVVRQTEREQGTGRLHGIERGRRIRRHLDFRCVPAFHKPRGEDPRAEWDRRSLTGLSRMI